MDSAFFCIWISMMRIYLSATAFIIFIGLVSCSGDKPIVDRFSFKPPTDSTFHFTIQIVDSSGPAAGSAALKYQWIEFTMQKVQEKDSLTTMKLVIERLRITQPGITLAESKKGTIVFLPAGTSVTLSTDSAERKKITELFPAYYDTWTKILPQLRGESLQVIMNNQGEVMQVTGFDKILEKIAAATALDRRIVKQYLDDYAGNESIRDLLNQLFFFLPGRKIQQGDHWVKNITMIAKAPIKQSHLITVADIDKETDAVRLNVQAVVSAKTSEEGRQYAEGEVSGKISANYTTGMPFNIYLTQLVTTHTDQYDRITKRVIYTPRF